MRRSSDQIDTDVIALAATVVDRSHAECPPASARRCARWRNLSGLGPFLDADRLAAPWRE